MYGQSGHGVRTVSVASGATVSSAYTVLGGCNALAIEIATFAVTNIVTTTANIYCQVCDTETGTFRRLAIQGVYSSGSGILDWEVPSSVGGRYWQLPNEVTNYNYMRVELSNASSGSTSIRIHSMR